MGHSLCLQNWVSVAGQNTVVVQNDANWADLAGYEDIAIYLDVGSLTAQGASSTTVALETAVSKDETLFASLSQSYLLNSATTLGVQPIKMHFSWSAANPIARYLRWSVTIGAVATTLHFRIWLNLFQTGW